MLSMKRIESFVTNECWAGLSGEIDYFGGIIGGEEPSTYSKSPFLWNRFFQCCHVNGFFTALDFLQKDRLHEFLAILLSFPGCTDITITNPYKTDAYVCMKQFQFNHFHIEIADRVHHLECLNHIIPDYRNKIIYVDNTDGQGMILAIKKRRDIEGKQVLLVGAGGAAAAIGYELVKAGAELRIANIIEEDAKSLEKKLSFFKKPGHSIYSGGWEQIQEWAPPADIIISTITASTPLLEKDMESISTDCLCVDTRCGKNSIFSIIAKNTGHPWIDGREMLYGQFELAAIKVGTILNIEQTVVEKSLEMIRKEFIQEIL